MNPAPRPLSGPLAAVLLGILTAASPLPEAQPAEPATIDLQSIAPDLRVPPVSDGEPAPGRRVRRTLPRHAGTRIHHLLYLPTDWAPDRRFPVLVEYAGNRWRTSPGTVEGSSVGYGLSGGAGFIWLQLPFVDLGNGENALQWWGDVEATVEYCITAVDEVCRDFGGDRNALVLTGFSRGAIACNFIGLHDDRIASLWKAFFCHSHYDGVYPWNYAGSDRESAARRLERLRGRPQFISHESSVAPTRDYLAEAAPGGNFTFVPLPFPDHTDTWLLRDLPERRQARRWLRKALSAPAESQAP